MSSRTNFRRQYLTSLGFNDVRQKDTLLESILQEESVDLRKLRKIVESGEVPTKFRAEVWKLLLGVAPTNKESREFVLMERYRSYEDIKRATDLLRSGILENRSTASSSQLLDDLQEFTKPESILTTAFLVQRKYFYNNRSNPLEESSWEDLNRISRVFSAVFQLNGPPITSPKPDELKPKSPVSETTDDGPTIRQQFPFCDEADAFWCLSKFLNESVRPSALQIGVSMQGILSYQVRYLSSWLESRDPVLFKHLQNKDASIDHFSVPWFRSCFSNLFPLDSLLKIWYKVVRFSSDFLVSVAIVLVQSRKTEILEKNDAASINKLLSELPPDFNIEPLITRSVGICADLPSLLLQQPLDTKQLAPTKKSGGLLTKLSNPHLKKVTFKFYIHYYTQFGEVLSVIGSIGELGNWKESQARKMTWNEGSLWTLEFTLKQFTPFEYKYLVLNTKTKALHWEVTPNRKVTSPTSDQCEIHDKWEVILQEPH